MRLSSVVALFPIAISALGEKSAPAISDGSTAGAALTPNFPALSQNALNQLSSFAQKSSVYLADTAISAYQASKSRLTSVDYNKLSTDVQEKFREAQDSVLAIDYNKLSTDVQEKFREVQDGVLAIDYNKLPIDVQKKFREVQDGVLAIDYNKLSMDVQEKFREVQDGVLAIDYDKLSTDVQEKFREVQDGVLAIDYKHLPTDVKDWITAHPYQTAFHIVGGVVFFAPGLVSTPLLGALGWTSVGPRAASVASGIQATFGTGAAGSIFATFESAAMGGYGVAPVAWSMRAGVGASQVALWAWGGEKQKARDAKDEGGAEALVKSNS